jgi:undecaprenyl-diphosphatase
MDLELYKSVILGAVQGFTEFLPISSTAHLILSSKLIHLESSEFIKSFIIIIQFASILAVVVLYRKKIFKDWEYLKKLFVACIPTGVLGLLAYNLVKNYLHESLSIIAFALLIGGIIMIVLERKYKTKKDQNEPKNELTRVDDIKDLSYKQCLIIGVFQALAMIPGVSRSAATIIGGLSLGISRSFIVEFSFLLAIPTMFAASSLDLLQTGFHFTNNELIFLIIGCLISFIVAWFSIKFLLNFVRKHNFNAFAWYRIALAIIIMMVLYI